MPFQVSGQFVTANSSRLVHVAGWDGALVPAAGAAFVAMMSSAEASVAHTTSRSKPDIATRLPMRAIAPTRRSTVPSCGILLEPTLPDVPQDTMSGRAPLKHRIIQHPMQPCKVCQHSGRLLEPS